MKRQGLYIIVCGFMLSLLLPANSLYGRTVVKVLSPAINPVLKSAVNYFPPEAGLKNGGEYRGNVHSYRIHAPVSAFISDLTQPGVFYKQIQKKIRKENFSCKAYLDHLYPSHNFW
jgi:hypothetical protein